MIKCYTFKDKDLDMAKNKAMSILKLSEKQFLYNIVEEKTKIFKSCTIDVYKLEDIINFVKIKLEEIFNLMDINNNINIEYKNNVLFIEIDGENNNILIGKDGVVLKSIEIIIKELVNKYIKVNINLDISSYRKDKNKQFKKEIEKLIKEVNYSGIPYKFDSMNAYQRKIIHEIIQKYDNLISKNYGEEPNRYIIVERKEK